MIYIENHSTDPCVNLALEEYFLKQSVIDEDVFILWQNEPVVVVGKNQDTLKEINLDYVRENNIRVVRRITGGGAVYHDLGNINFSIIRESGGKTDFDLFAAPVIYCLKSFGVEAVFSGRNDILIDGKKISGNAQCYHKNKVLHHGTLLFNSDLGVLMKALNPNAEKLSARGIKSVKSRVANISDYLQIPLTVGEFNHSLAESFSKTMARYEVSEKEWEAIRRLADSKYRSNEWNYGSLPEISLISRKRFDAGLIEVRLNISNEVIQEIVLAGDFFEGTLPLEELKRTLIGKNYDSYDIHEVLESINVSDYIQNLKNHEFINLMFNEVETNV